MSDSNLSPADSQINSKKQFLPLTPLASNGDLPVDPIKLKQLLTQIERALSEFHNSASQLGDLKGQIDQIQSQLEPSEVDPISVLKQANPELFNIIAKKQPLQNARTQIFEYLSNQEQKLLAEQNDLPALETVNARECLKVLRNILSTKNEKRADIGTLEILQKAIQGQEIKDLDMGFYLDFTHLFKGVLGKSGIYEGKRPKFLDLHGRAAALERSDFLDQIADSYDLAIKKYQSGLEPQAILRREENKQLILKYFDGTETDWQDWQWHVKHIVRDSKTLGELIEISDKTSEAIDLVCQNKIPFGITPYYVSLMDHEQNSPFDNAVRNQVIPPWEYAHEVVKFRANRHDALDFMKEGETSPVDLVTRRYPLIAILKPFNTCPQICVYCQRNWEIEECMAPDAMSPQDKLDTAIDWYARHPAIKEVLITGGDPGIMNDDKVDEIFGKLAVIPHLERIRFATRIPITLPQRITNRLIDILAKYHEPGKREVYVVTHAEHAYEITPDTMQAVQKIRKKGMNCYNQEVFTPFNSRRFESVALRRALKLVGIDPYYNFNPKGKKEAKEYLVPIARILQERKEEARLMPGSARTDEAVFNVPGLGKNHLRSWQDHEIIAIKPDGSRVYMFHPWEKNINPVDPYVYADRPIMDYLRDLEGKGENIEDYETIWYYY